jgi:hypothetical protein
MDTVVTNRDQIVKSTWSQNVRLSETRAETDTCAVPATYDQVMRAFACRLLGELKSWRKVEAALRVSHQHFSGWRRGDLNRYFDSEKLDNLVPTVRKDLAAIFEELTVLAEAIERGEWKQPDGVDMAPSPDRSAPVLLADADADALEKQPSAKKRKASQPKPAKASARESDGRSPRREPEHPAKSPR